jgi:sugar-specific transcriptional regulator TrmB
MDVTSSLLLMDPLVTSTLESLGLNPKEITAYLTLLSVGTAPASAIAHRAGITRSTAQYTCQQLTKKGIVQMIPRGNTYLFTPEQPEKLLLLLQRQKQELERKEMRVHEIVGRLAMLINPQAVAPKVKFYDNLDGAINLYDELLDDLDDDTEILSIYKPFEGEMPEPAVRKLSEFDAACVRKRIRSRIIAPREQDTLERQKTQASRLEEIRLVEPTMLAATSTEMMIYKNKLYNMTTENGMMFGTVLENPSIIELQRGMFEMAWAHAGGIKKPSRKP